MDGRPRGRSARFRGRRGGARHHNLGRFVDVLPAAGQLPPGGTFTDDNGNEHEGMIEAIAAAGITLGCNPKGPCTARRGR